MIRPDRYILRLKRWLFVSDSVEDRIVDGDGQIKIVDRRQTRNQCNFNRGLKALDSLYKLVKDVLSGNNDAESIINIRTATNQMFQQRASIATEANQNNNTGK